MSEKHLIKAVKGVFLFIAFLAMGISIPDVNLTTLSYLQGMGFSPHIFQILLIISGFANLIIGINGAKWNAVWFAAWASYSIAALFAYLNGANTPLLAVCAYLILSIYLTMDVLEDAEFFKYIGNRLWNRVA